MSASIWSMPGSPFSEGVPQYSEKIDWTKVPKSVGIYFPTGERNQDIYKSVFQQSPKTPGLGTTSAIPPMDQEVQKYLDFYKAISPMRMAEMRQAAELSSELTREQLASLYPYLSAAGAESTARNLAASKSFLATKEQMPSSVQAIMASKQNQMATAAGAEAQRQMATAAQQQAAKDFAGRFAGQYIQVA